MSFSPLLGDYQAPSLYTTKKVILLTSASFQNVYSFSKTLYTSVYFEYNVQNLTNMRAGTIMAIWDGTNIEFTETTTMDLGSTAPVTFQVIISGNNIVLQCKVSTSTWTIKTIIRSI